MSETTKFTIYLNNLYNCSDEGQGGVVIKSSMLKIPVDAMDGAPDTLSELINIVGPQAVKMNWYAKAAGTVSSHDCWATYVLLIQSVVAMPPATSGNEITPSVALWRTSNSPNAGGPFDGPWTLMTGNTQKVVTQVSTGDDCDGSDGGGCGCRFPSKGGWKGTSISLRVDVEVFMMTFCTTGVNIHEDICYNYISDYISVTPSGATQHMSDYMGEYCNTKYPNGDLSLFNSIETIGDEKDYNICACNMPQKNYDEFYASAQGYYSDLNFGSIRYACLFPPCVNSDFMPNNLDKCPVPQCLNVVVLDGNEIEGDVEINQKADCEEYGITEDAAAGTPPDGEDVGSGGSGGDGGGSGGGGSGGGSGSEPPGTPSSDSGIPSWVWWVVGAIVGLLLLAALGGLGYYLFGRKKGVEGVDAVTANTAAVNASLVNASAANIPAANTIANSAANASRLATTQTFY